MTLFVEYHLIQNFAPSNLNRDDTGAPKDALFGGHRRARVSSQCQKRGERDWLKSSDLLDKSDFGFRTRHLDRLLLTELHKAGLVDTSIFNEVVKLSLKSKVKKDDDGADGDADTEDAKLLSYLLFVSMPELSAMRELIANHHPMFASLATKKKIKATDIDKTFKTGLKECLSRSRAIDIALFGRMLADMPEVNQDAACQVAHAISTHRVEREFDYFTAVDDASGPEETGAGMIGQVEFNSATFCRYAVVDACKLLKNLQGDQDLALAALEAFTQAKVRAVPAGKQNTFAAHNMPAFVGVCLRHAAPLNLANAFEKPVAAGRDQALSSQSVAELAKHEALLSGVYADPRDRWAYLDLSDAWPEGRGERHANLAALARWVKEQVAAEQGR